ncbi:MAG TPA: C4-type zinc ribbon domain-containing protein [Nitrospirota bacterium]|nr:C4-type zinc ribbon domain-containing protein [Nitrospirota bacterium]
MLEDLKLLVELQEIDTKIHELEKDKERMPRLIHLAGEALRAAQAEADLAGTALEEADKGKRTLEGELMTENEHMRKLKLRTTEIKTNKEYFAHLKEIEDCQKRIGKVEESSLELMEKVEKAEAELVEKQAALASEQEKFNLSKSAVEKRFAKDDEKLAELQAARGALIPKVSKAALLGYQAVLKMYPDSAIAQAKNGACTGCRMTIPPQQFTNVRKGETIIDCNQCHRILYYKEPKG